MCAALDSRQAVSQRALLMRTPKHPPQKVNYIGMTIIRATALSVLSPLLTRMGYGITWETIIAMTWGGLRGAVGLALALVVEHTPELHDSKLGRCCRMRRPS